MRNKKLTKRLWTAVILTNVIYFSASLAFGAGCPKELYKKKLTHRTAYTSEFKKNYRERARRNEASWLSSDN